MESFLQFLFSYQHLCEGAWILIFALSLSIKKDEWIEELIDWSLKINQLYTIPFNILLLFQGWVFFFQEHGPISSLYTVKMDLKLYYDSYQILCHFQVFQGNNDQETVVSHVLPQHIRARFVRFWPKTWVNKYRAMRAELYGCFLQ